MRGGFLRGRGDTSKDAAATTVSTNSALPETSVPNLCDNAGADGT